MDPTERVPIGRGVEVTRLAFGTAPICGLYEPVGLWAELGAEGLLADAVPVPA